jgi:hypothetical protein
MGSSNLLYAVVLFFFVLDLFDALSDNLCDLGKAASWMASRKVQKMPIFHCEQNEAI